MSSSIRLSVISRLMASQGTPCASRMPVTVSNSASCLKSCRERFTEKAYSGVPRLSRWR